MSGGTPALELTKEDLYLMLAADVHIGNKNSNFQMEQYIHGRSPAGNSIFRLRMTWEKILLAARAIAAVPNATDVFAIGTRPTCQRACLKFGHYVNATAIANRFTPGAFTNQIQPCFREPRLLIVSDPVADHQPVSEAAAVNIPVIGFCNSDTPLNYVDIAIPCNNQSDNAIGLMWWMLAREVRRIIGKESRNKQWDVMVDLFIYRKPNEIQQEADAEEDQYNAMDAPTGEYAADAPEDGEMPVPGMPAVGTRDAMATFHQNAQPSTQWAYEPDTKWA